MRRNFSSGDNKSFNSNFILRHRFRKPGRTISLSFDEQFRDNNSTGNLFAISNFYEKGVLKRIDTTDQLKINNSTVSGYNGKIAYTEPILKNTFVEVNYALRLTQSESERISYNRNGTGKYELFDPLFSNHYDFRVLTNTGGAMFRYNTKKYTLGGGGDIGRSNFRQIDLIKDTARTRNFTNLFPRGNFQYKFNANSRFSINYNGNTRQPTIDQIQPIRDNTNVLNIAIGNPNLKQEFRHNFDLSYNFYKVLTQRGFYMYSSFTTISNAISTSEFTATTGDTIGKRNFQYINVDGNYNANLGSGYSLKLTKLDLNVNFGLNFNLNHNNNVINNIKNISDNNSYGINLGLYKFKEKKYNFHYYSNIRYNKSISSVRSSFKTQYYIQNHNLNINLTLPARLEFNTSVNANFREKLSANDQNNNVVLWNAYVGRKLLKNDKAMIRIEGYDILDQNRGFSRFMNANILTERTYETLSQYFMLAFVWNFSKTPAGSPAPPR
jgi:hypothetical protein